MIELSHVSKYYEGVAAVLDVSFEIKRGELFTLIGRSGSGKSTLLKLLNRLLPFEEGHILVEGKDIRDENPIDLRRRMGYVIQDIGLFPHYTVAQNLAIVPTLLGWPVERIKERSDMTLKLLGLDPKFYRDRMPHELSGGQQQRVGIARALVAEPPILLMDEPFGSLDTLTKEEIHKEFALIRQKLEQTVVWVTHDIQAAFLLSDRICVLDDGEVKQIGTPAELLFEPANDFIEEFVFDHRLVLTQQILRVQDVLETLSLQPEVEEGLAFISIDTSLRDFQGLSLHPEAMIALLDSKRNTLGGVYVRDLMEAFLLKQHQRKVN